MSAPDVLVMGEVLVELTSLEPLHDGGSLRLGFSGDALNAAAAAAAGGARTFLLARIPDDELGDRMVERIEQLGVDTSLLLRVSGQHGVYFQHADPTGAREFVYVRNGSAGSTLCATDLPLDAIAGAGVVLASGIACAISAETFGAVSIAARTARTFIYDPNWRPRLADAATASAHLRAIAPYARLVTPAWPQEAQGLLDEPLGSIGGVLAGFRALGAQAVALTRGANGVDLDDGGSRVHLPAFPVTSIVDQTGAGDVLVGTTAARLALGDGLLTALRLGTAAAALSLQGHGGTGHLATLAETRALAETAVGQLMSS